MVTSMDRIVGPKADVMELEYIAALHQTSKETRPSGTISSLDIMRYLQSRHSLQIRHEQARDLVRGLGGSQAVAPELRMAMAERVAHKVKQEQAEQQQKKKTHHLKWRFGTTTQEEEHEKGENALYSSTLSSRGKKQKKKQQKEEEKNLALVQEALHPKILYLDLVQTTSILLMPTLARIGQAYTKQQHSHNNNNNMGKTTTTIWDVDNGMSQDQPTGQQRKPTTDPTTTSDDLDPQPDDLLEVVLQTMWNVIRSKQNQNQTTTRSSSSVTFLPTNNNNKEHDAPPPHLTAELVQWLLLENGETDKANDAQLVQEMVEVATTKGDNDNNNGGVLGMSALVRALTYDLVDYPVKSEDSMSTYVYDILGHETLRDFEQLPAKLPSKQQTTTTDTASPDPNIVFTESLGGTSADEPLLSMDKMELDEKGDNDNNNNGQQQMIDGVEVQEETFLHGDVPSVDAKSDCSQSDKQTSRIDVREQAFVTGSAKTIDTVVDAYGSTVTMILIWITYVGHSGAYASLVLATEPFTAECPDQTFGCTLGKTIYTWLVVAVMLAVFGFAVLLPLSYGNHPTKRDPFRMMVATILTGVITFAPFIVISSLEGRTDEIDEDVVALANNPSFAWIVYLTTALGSALTLNYLVHCCLGLIKKCGIPQEGETRWSIFHKFGLTSHIVGTTRTKRAATRKLNLMLNNAREMHSLLKTTAKTSDEQPKSAGSSQESSDAVFQNYTLRGERVVSAGSLVWSWHRIWTGDLAEVDGIWLPSRLLIFQVGQVIIGVFTSFVCFQLVGYIADAADEARVEIDRRWRNYPDWVNDLVPTGDEVRWALTPAAWIALIVSIILILNYIPSTVTTILMYRSGQTASLGAASFQDFRMGADKAYMNTANAIYGMIAGASLFYILIGLLLFLFVWDFSRDFVLLILAWGIGLTITIVLKSIMTSFCRKRFFRAFYRLQPGRANFTTLALECWFIGLGGGVLVGRITQFLLAAAFWIGRIDQPFLASNVSLLGYKFDYVPLFFTTDVLLHEAHRHPYIERLGTMYLMRLRNKGFGSDAGSAWRQLFVLTLMPWMIKYRVFHEQRCAESIQDQQSEREIELDEDKEALASAARELLGTKGTVAGFVDRGAKTFGDVGLTAVDTGINLLSMKDRSEANNNLRSSF